MLPVQLSIQTTESLQNKVGRKNTPEQQTKTQNKKKHKTADVGEKK